MTPAIARGDAGLPMLLVTLPGMLAALVPVIAVEAVVVHRRLGTRRGATVRVVALANLASTLVGVPLAWVALAALEIATGGGRSQGIRTPLERFLAVTWQAPWLHPYEIDLDWMIPAATLVLLIPFYFASWGTEYVVARRLWREQPAPELRAAIRTANLVSYSMLAVCVAAWLAWVLISRPST